jgi:dephospho-CoA kinase
MQTRPLKIGLTGGIGSGKSTVAAMLVQLGASLIDADAISRALTAADGSLARATMRARAFADATVRRRLETVMHPMIGAEAQRQADAATGTVRVFDVPLLAESKHWRARVDRVLVVDCSTDTQLQRVAARPGWTREAAANTIAAQAPREMRRAIADAVICNDGITLPELQAHTEALWRLWNNHRPMI